MRKSKKVCLLQPKESPFDVALGGGKVFSDDGETIVKPCRVFLGSEFKKSGFGDKLINQDDFYKMVFLDVLKRGGKIKIKGDEFSVNRKVWDKSIERVIKMKNREIEKGVSSKQKIVLISRKEK